MPRAEPPPVDEPEEEHDAERDPRPPRVQHLAAERPDAPPRHAPGDLRARPGLGHAAVAVLDLAERDLPGLARPDLHRPAPGRDVERRLGRRVRRIPVEPGGDLRVLQKARHDCLLGQPRLAADRGEGLLDRPAPAVGTEGSGRVRGSGGGSEQQRERRGARPPLHRRKDQSLLPRKLSGVTSTIATACAAISPTPAVTSRCSTARFASSDTVETTRNRAPCAPT